MPILWSITKIFRLISRKIIFTLFMKSIFTYKSATQRLFSLKTFQSDYLSLIKNREHKRSNILTDKLNAFEFIFFIQSNFFDRKFDQFVVSFSGCRARPVPIGTTFFENEILKFKLETSKTFEMSEK
jgi:hypothetical protein